jgi:hypothetical protein
MNKALLKFTLHLLSIKIIAKWGFPASLFHFLVYIHVLDWPIHEGSLYFILFHQLVLWDFPQTIVSLEEKTCLQGTLHDALQRCLDYLFILLCLFLFGLNIKYTNFVLQYIDSGSIKPHEKSQFIMDLEFSSVFFLLT